MDLTHARHLGQLARAAYLGDPDTGLPSGVPFRLDPFATPGFRGLACSDGEAAYLVFRGTKARSGDEPDRHLAAWLTNLDFTQVETGGCRIHRGFGREVEAVLEELERLAKRHGAGRRPLWLTGHSAGGALATVAARRLKERGLPVAGAVVFSAPRVGDRAFAASYPVPLWRLEGRHDIVPHLPLPPRLAWILGELLVDPWLERRARREGIEGGPGLRLAGTEYVHAGRLFYDDGVAALYRVPPGEFWRRYVPLIAAELKADIARLGAGPTAAAYAATACPGWATPVPARLLDAVRFSTTLKEVARQVRAGSRQFLNDHRIDTALAFLDRIGLARPA